MRSWILRGFTGLAAVGLLSGLLFLPIHSVDSGVIETCYLSLDPGVPAPGVFELANAIPGDCATWHELYPAFCVNHHQDAYNDNGDGVISACDEIVLDGVTWHVNWVGPTYYLTCFPLTGPPEEVIWEPNLNPHDPGNPICETWHEVWPNFCTECHIDDWFDADGSGDITPCDDVFSKGVRYHVDDIRVNIIVEPPGTPVEKSTWGLIKNWFHDRSHDRDDP